MLRIAPWCSDIHHSFQGSESGRELGLGLGLGLGFRVRVRERKRRCVYYCLSPERAKLNPPSILLFFVSEAALEWEVATKGSQQRKGGRRTCLQQWGCLFFFFIMILFLFIYLHLILLFSSYSYLLFLFLFIMIVFLVFFILISLVFYSYRSHIITILFLLSYSYLTLILLFVPVLQHSGCKAVDMRHRSASEVGCGFLGQDQLPK